MEQEIRKIIGFVESNNGVCIIRVVRVRMIHETWPLGVIRSQINIILLRIFAKAFPSLLLIVFNARVIGLSKLRKLVLAPFYLPSASF